MNDILNSVKRVVGWLDTNKVRIAKLAAGLGLEIAAERLAPGLVGGTNGGVTIDLNKAFKKRITLLPGDTPVKEAIRVIAVTGNNAGFDSHKTAAMDKIYNLLCTSSGNSSEIMYAINAVKYIADGTRYSSSKTYANDVVLKIAKLNVRETKG